MTTTNERLVGLHGRQIGPVSFDSRVGITTAVALGQSVEIETDDGSLWCSATTQVPQSPSGLVDAPTIERALTDASIGLSGVAAMIVRGNTVISSIWIEAESTPLEIAAAARETAKMSIFVDDLFERLEATAIVRAELDQLERKMTDSSNLFGGDPSGQPAASQMATPQRPAPPPAWEDVHPPAAASEEAGWWSDGD